MIFFQVKNEEKRKYYSTRMRRAVTSSSMPFQSESIAPVQNVCVCVCVCLCDGLLSGSLCVSCLSACRLLSDLLPFFLQE